MYEYWVLGPKRSSLGGTQGTTITAAFDFSMSTKGNSGEANRNVVNRHCLSSCQYSGTHYSCNKEALAAF